MAKIIKLVDSVPRVIDDDWEVVRTPEDIQPARLAHSILPFAFWRNMLDQDGQAPAPSAIWLSPDDDFEPCMRQLGELGLIAVDFPSFRDGRGYSIATLLRARYGWFGELRAIGDVLRDQLNYMRRCGFNAFAVRADKDIHDAIKSFSHYSVRYQGAVDEPLPLFRRRNEQGLFTRTDELPA